MILERMAVSHNLTRSPLKQNEGPLQYLENMKLSACNWRATITASLKFCYEKLKNLQQKHHYESTKALTSIYQCNLY